MPPFAKAEVSSRPIKPLPACTTYDEMLFIAQLKEAGIAELQAAREEFFNAELLVRDVNDKGVEQEVAGLHTVRSETRSLWSQEYNDACEKNAGADSPPGLHGADLRAIRDLHVAQGPRRCG